jgi:hypothetical protein
VQQLDSVVVVPTNEADVDALGNVPELPATERNGDASSTPHPSTMPASEDVRNKRMGRDSDNHVMSWAQFNSTGVRNAASKLSQPHASQDVINAVWGNMSPEQREKGEKEEKEEKE